MIILTIDIDRIERIQTCFYSFIYFCEHKYGVFIVKLISIFEYILWSHNFDFLLYLVMRLW